MKTPKNVVSSAPADADLLTPGDRRGLTAAKKLVEKLKEEYAAGKPSTPVLPDHISLMAGPVRKR